MSLNPTVEFLSSTFSNDSILAGRSPVTSRKVTLLSGEASRVRGSILGRKAITGTTAGAAQAGNTGTGTIGSISIGSAARNGRYRLVCTQPITGHGTFDVFAPDGRNIGVAQADTAFAGEINFTIAHGGTDFVAGDAFNVDVSALTYKYLLSLAAATDGSQIPEAILAEDADATSGDVDCLIYEDGVFNDTILTFGTGHTTATVRDVFRAKGIIVVDAQTIVNP